MKIEISLDTKDAADLAALMALVGSLGGKTVEHSGYAVTHQINLSADEIRDAASALDAFPDEPEGGISTGGAQFEEGDSLPNPEGAPDNLYAPLNQHHSGEGTIGDHALPRSLYTRWQLATPLRSALRLVGGTTRAPGARA